MLKWFKEFDKRYSTLFFCFALLIIIVFLFYSNTINKNDENTCTIPNSIVNNYTNYAYDIVITKNDAVSELYVKRYDTKYLVEKNENGVKSAYYIYHTDLLERASNGEYIRYRKDNIVDGIDNKFLILDYINEISLKSTVSTDNELTCYNNRKIELSMCINLDNSITLEVDDYTIVYKVKEVGSIDDFDVDANLNYESEIENITDESDNNVIQ